MKIPKPHELGLPEKYQSYRPDQEDFITNIVRGTKRVTASCAPTGFGKLVAIIVAALISKIPTCIVTMSNGLIQQALDEFGSIGLVALLGRNNYTCGMKDDYTCEDGYPAQCPYKGTPMCPSTQAELRMAVSYLGITNYSKWTSSHKYGTGMSHWQQVIFDEAHFAYDALASAMQVKLHQKEIERTLGVDFLTEVDDFKPWKHWAATTRVIAEQELVDARKKLIRTSNPTLTQIRHYFHMRNLTRKLATLATAGAREWVVDPFTTEHSGGFVFDPISPGRYVESSLLMKVPKVAMVSATLRPKSMYIIGIGNDNFSFKEYDSRFNPARHPIYWVQTMRVDGKARDLSMLWLRHDQLAAKRQDRKGIVHSISYERQEQLFLASRFRGNMILNRRGEDIMSKIDDFRLAGPGTELISPSVGTGFDFADSQCRWQLVLKVPFEPPSKIQKARQALDKEYVYYRAMQYLVQAFGRDVRSSTDWAEAIICDDHFGEWFMPRYGHLAPKSFHQVYRATSVLPQPIKFD